MSLVIPSAGRSYVWQWASGLHHFGGVYLYIGITSCDYKISQIHAIFNWEMRQNIQKRLVNIADSVAGPLTGGPSECYNVGDVATP